MIKTSKTVKKFTITKLNNVKVENQEVIYLVRIFTEKNTYHVFTNKFDIAGHKLFIDPLDDTELGHEFYLRGFKISFDMKTEVTTLLNIKLLKQG